ncbi:hypothetical protein KY285_013933 [Solanum tuberosum]|nr:hypothetical protein KY285_013933 [Solanum tuberosum]
MDSSPINNMTINLSHVAEEEEEVSSKFKKLISTLPKEKGSNDFMDLYQYQGFWYPFPMLQAIISAQENFKSSWNDIYICSAPKTGCTWLKALCYAIVTRDHFNMENSPLLTNLPHVLIPSLEFDSPKNPSDMKAQNIPLIATHIPFDALPKSVQSLDGTKMIYLCREPKDTFISLWHFMQRFTWLQQGELDETTELLISFEEGFELFCEGKTMWGPYWDHVLGYWKQSLDRPESLLFLKYEELTKDTLFYVRKLAEFMGKPFSRDEEGEGLPERIVKLCSFDNLSNLEVIKNGKNLPISSLQIDNSAYFRKVKPGDWKNHLTDNMIERMDHITKEKLRGSNFKFGVSTITNS